MNAFESEVFNQFWMLFDIDRIAKIRIIILNQMEPQLIHMNGQKCISPKFVCHDPNTASIHNQTGVKNISFNLSTYDNDPRAL